LVEGDAEEILIPLLIKRVLGVCLDELGVSLINIRSTGFKNVAVLFHDLRIRKRCSIVTDLDAPIIDTTPSATDTAEDTKFKQKCKRSADVGSSRRDDLLTFIAKNTWLSLHLAQHTFEVEFLAAGNVDIVKSIVERVYTNSATALVAREQLSSTDVSVYGRRMLTMANHEGKGWFAILLGDELTAQAAIPNYVIDAVFFGATITRKLWFDILNYRAAKMAETGLYMESAISDFRKHIEAYRDEIVDFSYVKSELKNSFRDDALNKVLARLL
jgi:putative ATP-dependent endonuclease of OLD family